MDACDPHKVFSKQINCVTIMNRVKYYFTNCNEICIYVGPSFPNIPIT